MSLLSDLWRALRLRPEQLSVPMTERRDLPAQLADIRVRGLQRQLDEVAAERDRLARTLAALRLGLDRLLLGHTESDEERLSAVADLVLELDSWTRDQPQPGEGG